MTSTVASAIRPSLRDRDRQPSGSPHTPPTRHISSVQSSPGSSFFRAEEDPIIIELDPRYLNAGFQGDSGPQCCLRFNPENNRRVGDYRTYLPEFRRRREDVKAKSKEYELWRADLKDVDLGLVEDKLERAVRDAYNKYLLVDAGAARLVLVLPSLMPLPVMETMIRLLFERWKYSSVTILPAPTMTVAAAGLRSGLVVDLGWEETVVTAIYEYREVHVSRSTRAMRALVWRLGEFLETIRKEQDQSIRNSLRLDFDFVEEIIDKAGACHALVPTEEEFLAHQTESLQLDTSRSEAGETKPSASLVIDWPTDTSSQRISIPRAALQKICLETFVGSKDEDHPDDHEQPVSQLLYKTLLSVSSDVRSICMSRIIFSGSQASSIAGLPRHILRTADSIITQHGWTGVRGKRFNAKRSGLTELAQVRATPVDARYHTTIPTAGVEFEEQLLKQKAKPVVAATLRQVDSLGAWAGASLVASLKAKSFVEIEKEKFLSHGLAGAHRDVDHNAVSQRATTVKAGEKATWTLAGWG